MSVLESSSQLDNMPSSLSMRALADFIVTQVELAMATKRPRKLKKSDEIRIYLDHFGKYKTKADIVEVVERFMAALGSKLV